MTPKFQNRSFQRAERVPDIEGKSNPLAQQELPCQNLLLSRVGEFISQLSQAGVQSLSLASEEQTGLEDILRRVCHDGVGDVESTEENGRSRSNLCRESAEVRSANQLHGEELEQLCLLRRCQELWHRLGRIEVHAFRFHKATRNICLRQRISLFSQFR